MSFVNITNQGSDIYITIKTTEKVYEYLRNVRNIYVRYQIKTQTKTLNEIELIQKNKIKSYQEKIILFIKFNHLHHFNEYVFFLESLQFNLPENTKLLIPINQEYLFKNNSPVTNGGGLDSRQESFSESSQSVLDRDAKDKDTRNLTKIFSNIEQEITEGTRFEKDKFNMELNELCCGIFNMFLSILPLPETELNFSNSIMRIRSIRNYIQKELIRGVGKDQ